VRLLLFAEDVGLLPPVRRLVGVRSRPSLRAQLGALQAMRTVACSA
jgi:hypothetical protein